MWFSLNLILVENFILPPFLSLSTPLVSPHTLPPKFMTSLFFNYYCFIYIKQYLHPAEFISHWLYGDIPRADLLSLDNLSQSSSLEKTKSSFLSSPWLPVSHHPGMGPWEIFPTPVGMPTGGVIEQTWQEEDVELEASDLERWSSGRLVMQLVNHTPILFWRVCFRYFAGCKENPS